MPETTNGNNLQARLSTMEEALRRLDEKLDRFFPLAERVAKVETSVASAHHRIDANDAEHQQILAELRTLSWRVALIVGAGAGAVQLALKALEHLR